jgi:hypothetical protein
MINLNNNSHKHYQIHFLNFHSLPLKQKLIMNQLNRYIKEITTMKTMIQISKMHKF